MKISKFFRCCLLFVFDILFVSSLVVGKLRVGREEALDGLFMSKADTNHVEAQTEDLNEFEYIHANVNSQIGLKEADRIMKFPRQPLVDFEHFGGYITVSQSAGRAMYYYFAEATKNKESSPLLLWLNGGPGCSSLAYGAMQELGPFRVHSDGKTLFRNPYAWNNAANVLFLESPAGVGFSYSNTTSDYMTNGDKKTALDNYIFLLIWLNRFPEYKNREFYISGESYAGHYVPQLAHLIVYYNKMAGKTLVNLKGIIIGNAVINSETDYRGMFEYFAGHALIPRETNDKIQSICNFTGDDPKFSSECRSTINAAFNDIDYLDIFNIYAPNCVDGNVTARPKKASVKNIDPCITYYTYAYMNLPVVQRAIHANVTRIKHDWEPCSDVIRAWGDSANTTIPILRELMANGIRVWMFSGDIDGRVPFTSTLRSLATMNMTTKAPWRSWFHEGEVGGYIQVFEGDLTFVTVRGSGHMVPSDQPSRALSLISHFLAMTPLPDKP